MGETILVRRDGAIATVVLNRPDKLNAFDLAMWTAFGAAVRALSADDRVRCVVIAGAGGRAFSAGADIAEFEGSRSSKAAARAYGATMHGAMGAIGECRHPVVATIGGLCVGGGLEVAACCDLRICGESARFGIPVKTLGLVVAYAELKPLVALVGAAKAMEILLEGRIFGAAEAGSMGLVNRVVPDAALEAQTAALAGAVAEGAPLVARWHKKFVRRLADPRALSEAEYDESFDCFDTADFRAGRDAFLAKAKPVFTGR